jgi:hypothetical protein
MGWILAPCERVLAMEGALGFVVVRGKRMPANLSVVVLGPVGDSGVGVDRAVEVWGAEILQPKFPPVCSGRYSRGEAQVGNGGR